jgi:hypothetical protein
MTSDTTPRAYTGLGRFLDRNGLLIDVGRAELTVTDEETGDWGGTLAVYKGSSLVGKQIVGLLELTDGRRTLVAAGPVENSLPEDQVSIRIRSVGPTIPL